MGYSTLYSDADAFHTGDPWKLLKETLSYEEPIAISSNSKLARLADANPGVQYFRAGQLSTAYVSKWYKHRQNVGTASGNQRALTNLLARERWMARATKIFSCASVASGCCLRDCCVSTWERIETLSPGALLSEISNNPNLAWMREAPIFHAACLGGTPEKKLRRMGKLAQAYEMMEPLQDTT